MDRKDNPSVFINPLAVNASFWAEQISLLCSLFCWKQIADTIFLSLMKLGFKKCPVAKQWIHYPCNKTMNKLTDFRKVVTQCNNSNIASTPGSPLQVSHYTTVSSIRECDTWVAVFVPWYKMLMWHMHLYPGKHFVNYLIFHPRKINRMLEARAQGWTRETKLTHNKWSSDSRIRVN